MHAPVDQHAAAGDFLGGKRAAQPRNAAMLAEADVYMVHRAQAPLVDILLDLAHAVVKAVDHADDQDLARFALSLHHLLHLGIGAGGGLFAQHVFASASMVITGCIRLGVHTEMASISGSLITS